MEVKIEFLPKQRVAYNYLTDDITTELLYGGQAGGGKSVFGCMWVTANALRYPMTRWLIGRSKLNTLKETTLISLWEVFSRFGLISGVHYDYNQKDNYIQFKPQYGGSRILMKDLFAYPSDPEFDSLGSLEITGAFIDEGNQIVIKAKNIINSRIRYHLSYYCTCGYPTSKSKILEWEKKQPVKWLCGGCGKETTGLLPRLLVTCNPSKKWVYNEFYRPYRDGTLPEYRQFVPASVYENIYIGSYYVDNLKKLDPVSRARLLDGNWEYEDDDTVLMDYENILNIFNNELPSGNPYITCDYGRFGKDPTIILVWDGWTVIRYQRMDMSSTTEAAAAVQALQLEYGVPIRSVVVDEGGSGSGVVDILKCYGFTASAKVIYVKGVKENYLNIKAQCAFRFAEKVNKGQVAVNIGDVVVREAIIQELEHTRRKDPDKDGKLNIEGKDKMRGYIGRSTDWFDALYMREYLDLKKFRRFKI